MTNNQELTVLNTVCLPTVFLNEFGSLTFRSCLFPKLFCVYEAGQHLQYACLGTLVRNLMIIQKLQGAIARHQMSTYRAWFLIFNWCSQDFRMNADLRGFAIRIQKQARTWARCKTCCGWTRTWFHYQDSGPSSCSAFSCFLSIWISFHPIFQSSPGLSHL